MANELVLISVSDLTSIIQSAISNFFGQPKKAEDTLLSSEDVRDMLKVSDVTLCKWRKLNKIPFMRIDNKIYYRKSEIIDMLQKRA